MKKYILLIVLIIIIFALYKQVSAEESIIPDEAIRFRVIANSNSIYDQNIKIQIRNTVQNEIFNLIGDSKDIKDTREILKENTGYLENIVKIKIKELNYDKNFHIHYGQNYFPRKKYKGILYNAGNYESLVITLGDGQGDNWWCVLFPPLCLLESEDSQSTSDTEYTFFIKELIEKYF